jgi:PAS domain S-box-containing protein
MSDTPSASVNASREELRASEARYRSLVKASSAIVWRTTAGGVFDAEQPGWVAFTGQPFDAHKGWGWLAAVHPDDREHTATTWRVARESGSMYETVHRLRRADGVYRFMAARAVPIIDDSGVLTEWVGLHVDIDERKQVEERLRFLDAMSQATRNAADATSIMQTNTRMLGQHLGATRCPYADVDDDNDRFTIRHDWTAEGAVSTVGVYSLDLFGAHAAGELRAGRTLSIADVDSELKEQTGAAMFNAIACKAIVCCPLVKEGRLVAMMAVHQDAPRAWTEHEVALVEETVERSWAHIERVRVTEALHEADRRKSEFLAILAHELRNPLAPIRNGLEVMRLAGNDPAAIGRVRDMMERQVNQMIDLVNDLLDVARITRGEFALKLARVSLQSVVANAVETSKPLLDANDHQLTIELPQAPLNIEGDPTRLAQVLGNLLNNAAKYTAPGGQIGITGRREGDTVCISVTDNGIGIPPESARSVFDMFSQVGTAMERSQGGLGIGLSLARRLVELHGGRLDLIAQPGVAGCRFDICLPVATPATPALTNAHAPMGDGEAPQRALRVLVVDDNVDAADMLSALIEMIGHTPRVANNGQHALRIAADFVPEVAILDIGMPEMNGYELSEKLGEMAALRGLTRIALTGWGEDNDRARSRAAGFDHHLLKPCNLADVETLLRELAARP